MIVARDEAELERLDELHRRGLANGVQGLEMVGPERLRELEPHCVGVRALWSPNTGIVDYSQVAAAYASARHEHLDTYLSRHPHFLEHLALNQVWLGTFPFHPERTFAEEHALLAFRLGLARLHLAGAAAAEGGLTDELVIETIQAFDKYVDGHSFWDRTMKLLRDERALDPPSLAALLIV